MTSLLNQSLELANDHFPRAFRNESAENNTEANIERTHMVLQYVVRYVSIIYVPILVCFGLVGNMVSIYLLRSTVILRRLPSTLYVVGIICADSLYLIALAHRWITDLGVFNDLAAIWCNCNTFINGSSRTLSAWFVVAICVDWSLRQLLPKRIKSFSTKLKARAIMVALGIVIIVLFLNVSLLTGTRYYDRKIFCVPIPRFEYFLNITSRIDSFANYCLPLSFIVGLRVITWCLLKKQEATRKSPNSLTSGATNEVKFQTPLDMEDSSDRVKTTGKRFMLIKREYDI